MKANLPVLMNLYRGGAAIVLGILLLFIPDVSKGMLFNLMGFFWLTVGFAVLRRSHDDERSPGKRTALVAGLVAVLAGLLVVTRSFTRQWVSEDVVYFVLGTVILATGLLHMFSEYRIGGLTTDRKAGVHFLLGLFEVVLGGLLILTPRLNTPFLYWVATIWAFVYGAFFVGTAISQYRQRKQEETSAQIEGNPGYE